MATLRPSSIPWIGDIPQEWRIIKLKYASQLKGRIGWQGLTTDEYRAEGPYLVTGTDFDNGVVNWERCQHVSEERYQLDIAIQIKEDDLLITKDGTIGKVAVSKNCPEKVCLNSGVFIIRNTGNYKYNSRFMYYVLQSEELQRWFSITDRGNSTVKHLTQEKFYNFSFAYPSIDEQKAIASYLDDSCSKLDEIITEAEKSIEEYKELKQAVIFEAVTKGLEKNVPMKDSGVNAIGQVNCFYSIAKISQLNNGLTDGTHGTFNRLSSGRLLLSSKNVQEDGLIIGNNESYISEEDHKSIVANGFPHKNDVLLCCIGASIGRCILYPYDEPIAFQRSVIFITPNRWVTSKFLMYSLLSISSFTQEKQLVNQSAQAGLYQGLVKKIYITVPEISEQEAIVEYLDKKIASINSLIKEKKELIKNLNAYKKSLIYEIVTGKKRIIS